MSSVLVSPWAAHQAWMDSNHCYSDPAYIISYFTHYRDWLNKRLETSFPGLHDCREKINFAILLSLYRHMQGMGRILSRFQQCVLVRGAMARSDLSNSLTLDSPIVNRLLSRPEHTMRPVVSDPTFSFALAQVDMMDLRIFAETIFMGKAAYKLSTQVLTESAVRKGAFDVPTPGFDILYHSARGIRTKGDGKQT